MKTVIKTLGIAALVAFSISTQAQITFSTNVNVTAWSGSPAYVSLSNSSLSTSTFSAQGCLYITDAYGVLGETFTPGSTFTLGSISVIASFGSTNYVINLYDLGPAGAVNNSSGSAFYTPGTSLFSDTNVILTATVGKVQATFTLDAVDQVTLQAGEQYAFEIWNPTTDGNSAYFWYRTATPDPYGQMFSAGNQNVERDTLVANGQSAAAPKTAALALYAAVPATPITLTANLQADQIVVQYASGTLQSAPTVSGPWTVVTGANPPSYTAPITGTQLFFRAQQ